MWHSCELDEENCLDLNQILKVFSAPITEEHAWALVHQTVEILDTILDDDQSEFYRIETARDIIINVDGSVHFNTFYLNRNNRNILRSESLAIADLGAAIYDALDYSLEEDEQRTLSKSLENLIDKMTSADEDEDNEDNDEGIDNEDDYIIRQSGQCANILDLCRHHLASKSEAECHYRAVCRALVAEALEISTFMAKMRTTENENNEQLNELAMNDWANIWNDVMGELRHGIKLKKVTFSKTPTEFTLTPYEMLMADIRKKTAKLQPTRIPPKVKTDAKDIILDFIRSRPPLKPAANRKLAPKVEDHTPMEKLMQEIRDIDPSKCLKKTKCPEPRSNILTLSIKKTIRPDESFCQDILNFDEPDADEVGSSPVGPPSASPSDSPSPSLPRLQSKFSPNRLKPSDSSSSLSDNCDHGRYRTAKPLRKPLSAHPRPVIGYQSDKIESVKLSLFEFGHIRVQETRAELECGHAGADLEMGRVCFCCQVTRFRMLNWAYNCYFCKKNVCSSCFVKLKLPVEKLKEVTVASLISQLSPTQASTNESKTKDNDCADDTNDFGFVRASLNRISLRSSKQQKINETRKNSTPSIKNSFMSPQPSSLTSNQSYRPRMLRSSTTLGPTDGRGQKSNNLQQSTVCIKCKQSLIETIRSMSSRCRQSSTIIPGIKM